MKEHVTHTKLGRQTRELNENWAIEQMQRMREDPEYARTVHLQHAKNRRTSALLQCLSYRGALKDMQRYGRYPEREEGIRQYLKSYQKDRLLTLRRQIQELMANAPLP